MFRCVYCIIALIIFAASRSGAEVKWQKVATEYFTVYSQTSVKEARAWAVRLERFRLGLEQLFPNEGAQLEPVIVLIFRRDRDFDPFKPPQLGDPDNLIGVFQRRNGRNLIGMSVDRTGRDLDELVFHEAAHWFFSARGAHDPAWVSEGLAEVFSTYRVEGEEAVFGGDNLDDILALRSHGFMYVREIMNAPRWKVHSVRNQETVLFYAHAWLLVNFIFIDGNVGGRAAMERYLSMTRGGESHDKAFNEAFGITYEELDQRLDRYFSGGRKGSIRAKVGPAAIEFKNPGQQASMADINAALAFFLLAQGRDELAEPYLEKLKQAAPDDPRLFEGLAEIAERKGNYHERDRLYANAVSRGSTFYNAHFYSIAQRAQKYVGKEAAVDAIPIEEVAEVMALLRRTLELKPDFYPAYELMAGVMGCAARPLLADGEIIREGLRRFPDSIPLELGLAAYEIRTRELPEAKRRLEGLLAKEDIGWWGYYARKLLLRIKAMVDLAWLQRSVESNDVESVQRLHAELRQAALFPDERVEIKTLMSQVNQKLTLQRAQEALAGGNGMMAEFYLDQVAEEVMSLGLSAEYAKLRAELQQSKPRP